MLTVPMRSGEFIERAPGTAVFCLGLAFFLVSPLVGAPLAHAQPGDMPGMPGTMPAGMPADGPPPVGPPGVSVVSPDTAGTVLGGENLICDGGWRYSLTETRQEFGPARFARQTDLTRDIALVTGAFGYCEAQARSNFGGAHARSAGPCYGMLRLADTVDIIALNLFQSDDQRTCECLTKQARANSSCEGQREQLTVLRRYGDVIVDRAELVLAHQVCASIERDTNSTLRDACNSLDSAVASEHGGGRSKPGMFALAAPLPSKVAKSVDRVRSATDGRYLSVIPENFVGVRDSLCRIQSASSTQNSCELNVLDMAGAKDEAPKPDGTPTEIWGQKRHSVMWGMCNELAIADVNANTCRNADIYIDERGELHLNRPLTSRSQRKDATLCIDISDFDQAHPLMVTLGMDPTSSVPERIWPGETMQIGQLIDRPVTAEDVLRIQVRGKARGVSLAEVLRVNGVPGYTGDTLPLRSTKASRQEACRIARSWVPVVDHEVPIGKPGEQAVIPIAFGRGRDGETRSMQNGDYVVLWVRNIEPAGSVLAEYAGGQTVGYKPPPLLGDPDAQGGTQSDPDALMNPDAELRASGAGVSQPLLPRRARYPGSRVLRLGTPEGNQLYQLKVCTATGANAPVPAAGETQTCASSGGAVVLDEKLFVSGDYHLGLRLHFGYSYFPVERLVGRRTPAAEAAGDNIFEVVQSGSGTADYDVAALLAVYPFGRNPRRFSYKPWTRDYWKHSALLAGFTIRNTQPWDDFYMGASLPVANGVSISALSHFSRRRLPIDANVGELIEGNGGDEVDLNNFYDSKNALVVGVSFGLSFDYDLFERAFFSVWDRVRGNRGQFLSSSSQPGYRR